MGSDDIVRSMKLIITCVAVFMGLSSLAFAIPPNEEKGCIVSKNTPDQEAVLERKTGRVRKGQDMQLLDDGRESEAAKPPARKRGERDIGIQGKWEYKFIDQTTRLSIFSELREQEPFQPATPTDLSECLEGIIDKLILFCKKFHVCAEQTGNNAVSALSRGCAARLDASLREAWNSRTLLASGDDLLKALSFLNSEAIADQLKKFIEEAKVDLKPYKEFSFVGEFFDELSKSSDNLILIAKKAQTSVAGSMMEKIKKTFETKGN